VEGFDVCQEGVALGAGSQAAFAVDATAACDVAEV